ncbi:hypothetical protein H0H93_002900 [Arthromyces matolae]|nr:hypothetical protein H0H93_002900 [Arthromyces matolae]
MSIPAHLSYEEASTLPCAGLTAYNALNGSVPVKAGDYVLVLGTGGVSMLITFTILIRYALLTLFTDLDFKWLLQLELL